MSERDLESVVDFLASRRLREEYPEEYARLQKEERERLLSINSAPRRTAEERENIAREAIRLRKIGLQYSDIEAALNLPESSLNALLNKYTPEGMEIAKYPQSQWRFLGLNGMSRAEEAAEVVRLRDEELMTFKQIGKALFFTAATARNIYYRVKPQARKRGDG